MYIYDDFGKKRKISDLNAVETLFRLKRENGSNPWPVIEKCIEIWTQTNPREWKSFLYEVNDTKRNRRNEFAASDPRKDEKHGGIIRYTLDIPEKVMFMVRCVYDSSELDMNREFMLKWARKFPRMKIAEKI
jgi:hypothetical protein